MNSVSKNICINNLNIIGDKYYKTYRKTIKMKTANIKMDTYIDLSPC